MSQRPPDPLDPLLDRWSDTPEPSPRLAADVWQRIALHESSAPAARRWWQVADLWFARPAFAALFLLCCTLIGLLAAQIRVSRIQQERNAQLAQSYIQLIDPLLTENEAPPHT